MRQKIIEMIFGANQRFIVHSPRLRSLIATRHYSFIKHFIVYSIMFIIQCLITRRLVGRGFPNATKNHFNDFLRGSKIYRPFASLALVDRMIFCADQRFIVHSPRLRSLIATRHYSFIKHCIVNIRIKFIKNKIRKDKNYEKDSSCW